MRAGTNPVSDIGHQACPGPSPDGDAVRIDCERQHDLGKYADSLRHEGRVRIPGFLSSGAEYLKDFLAGTDEWIQVINTDRDVLEIDLDEWQGFDPDRRGAIQDAMYARASQSFQYSYAAIRVPQPDELDEEDDPLNDFALFMARPETKKMLEALTGRANLQFTDAQATAYHPGDILTGHDDAVAGKKRVAAFVLGMTPVWRLEWGGLLHFHPLADEPAITMVPQFNSLDLFLVPRLHSVSQVSPAALYPRYAITGWLSEQ